MRATLGDLIGKIMRWWGACPLQSQFTLAAAVVITTGMTILGSWVGGRIERGVIEHAATNSSLHLDSFVEPHLQALALGQPLSTDDERALSALVFHQGHFKSIHSITIWAQDGSIVFSTIPRLAGERRLMPAPVSKALLGTVQDKFEMVREDTSGTGPAAEEPVLKLYAPMHQRGTSRVIAVAEVHESAAHLQTDLARTRLQTAGVMALLSIGMLTTLFSIVRRGGQTITDQQKALSERVAELSQSLARNDELQTRVIEANRRSTDNNDRFLRRVGAELHDGPVQLIALALLRLEGLKQSSGDSPPSDAGNADEVSAIESALRDALNDIRSLSSGLLLPKMEGTSVAQVLEFAVRNHERRSRTRVKLDLAPDLPKRAPPLLLTCIYRFTQEGLNNAVRHADGKDQAVHAAYAGETLLVEIRDGGPGMPEQKPVPFNGTKGLGLVGILDRVESLNGRFEITSIQGSGTTLRVIFDKNALELPES